MKYWTYGINSLYRTASIELQTGPWWVFALSEITESICDLMPHIPLPKIKKRLRKIEDIEINGGENWTTWRAWYGDLSQTFHCFVHMSIFDFCQNKINRKIIDIDYKKAKDIFYKEDQEFWDKERGLL